MGNPQPAVRHICLFSKALLESNIWKTYSDISLESLNDTRVEGKTQLKGQHDAQYPAWSRHLPWLGGGYGACSTGQCVCARVCMHAWMREHGHAWCGRVGAWPSWRDHAALRWLRGIFHPRRQQAWADHLRHCRQRAAQIKGSGVCLCHTLISTSLSPDLSIIKCQGTGWKH